MLRPRYTRDAEHFEVVTAFEYRGRMFAVGEAFPWRDFELVEYQRRELWIANKIQPCAAPVKVAPPAPPIDPATAPPAVKPTGKRATARA